jgi:transcriptional regulator with XRE-family HTH domain
MENENIIKKTCKELGITQKELAEVMGVNEQTVGSWARGITNTPKWAINHFELLKYKKKYDTAKQIFCDLENK